MTTFTVDSTALFTLVAIAAGAGFFVGLGLASMRRGKNKIKPPKKGLLEVARIWRDKFNGQLLLQMEENTGSCLDDFSGDAREQAAKLVNDLAYWVDSSLATQVAENASRPDQPVPVIESPSTPPLAAVTAVASQVDSFPVEQAAQPNPAPQAPQTPQVSSPSSQTPQAVNPPRIDLVKGLRLSLEGQSARKIEESQNRSIASQVDEILQEKIKGTVLEQKAIRLMELPGKGMVVLVGLEQYDSLDAVPYPDVQAAIKYCVNEWEKKMLG